MTINKTAIAIFTGLTLGLTACGQDAKTDSGAKPAAKASKKSGPKFNMSKPAAFSLNKDCSTTDIVINSFPYMNIMLDGKMCDIGGGSSQPPVWTYTIGKICTQNGVITDTDVHYNATLTHQKGEQYLLTQASGAADKALTLCDADYASAPDMWSTQSEPSDINDFDFEQSYNKFCEGVGCVGGPKLYQKYSDYSANVLAPLNLSTSIEARSVKSHLKKNYGGRVTQSSFNNRKHPTDILQTFHLMPDGNPALHEYVLYVRVNGAGGFDKIKDWGGRVKCAPAKTDGPFQKMPCP